MIHVVKVKNPFQPTDGKVVREVPFDPDCRNLHGYLLQFQELGEVDLVDVYGEVHPRLPTVSVNGEIVDPLEWTSTYPADDSYIVITPAIGGGSLLRTLASVAVVAASIAVAAVSAGAGFAMLGMTTALTASVLGGAVSVAGNLLISAFMSGSSKKSNSPSYAFDGPASLAQAGTVIPKGYGTFQSGGNIIASFIDLEGPHQYINCLVCYGFGPARSISNIQIDGKDVSTYQNVQYYTRLGTNNQQPLPNFNRVVNGYPQDVECLAGQPIVVPGTGDLTQILQVDVSFPAGVWVLTQHGNLIPAVITYKVEYSVSGANDWKPVVQPLTTVDVVSYNPDGSAIEPHDWCVVATDLPPNSGVVYALDNGPHNPGDPWTGTQSVLVFNSDGGSYSYDKTCKGEWQRTNPLLNQVQVTSWTAGYIDFIGCDQSPLYNRTSIYGLAAGKYDVRVTKYGSAPIHDPILEGDYNSPNRGEQVWIHSVNEISLLDLAYPNMILVGVRALATNQLSGNNLNITALIQYGLRTLDNNVLPSALQAFEEDNPACVAADMMLDGLYGGGQWPGITAANIDRYIDEWVNWAELNDELVDDGNGGSIRRHVFNGVLDDENNLWGQLTAVGRMSRAQIMPLGRDYGVYVDQVDVPVQMFTMRNIGADSFTETWLDLDSRANQVEVQFADSTRYYKQDNPLVYMDPSQQEAGVTIKPVRIDGKGITVPAQAWHLARFKFLCNQNLLRTGSFKIHVDAIACRYGNLIILQHDVPQWGWGGGTLPGGSASVLLLDRDDVPFVAGTAYSVILLLPALQRYAGTLTTVAPVIDGTGANLGTALGLSSFDNEQRVTRCIVTIAGKQYDCPITSSSAGSVVVQPIPGFAPAAGQAYTLWDTDVLYTASVAGVTFGEGGGPGGAAVTLADPLPIVPPDFTSYFYGPSSSQKIVRVTNITKSSDFQGKIEWIDYSPACYVDATPVIGETSAQSTSNPGVTALAGSESFQLQAGSYIGYIQLSWKPGPDTVGVGIYGDIVGGNSSQPGGTLPMLARLTGNPKSWQMQADAGQQWTFVVVGFDTNDRYAAFASAPSVTVGCVGVAANLLLGSNFASGFTYWSITPRAGDSLVPNFADDGQADYTVAGTALTAAQMLMFQNVSADKWVIGDYLMLSAYFQDSCLNSASPNVGQLTASIVFQNAAGTVIGTATCAAALNGVAPNLVRVNTGATLVPALTVSVSVSINVATPSAGSMNVPVGSILTSSHLLLEICSSSAQTVPSEWADIDAAGQVLDLFTTGSSTGLRVQGSTLPTFSGTIAYAATPNTVTISWTDLVILWPDGGCTYVLDNSQEFTGLIHSTEYWAFLYFDIVNGGVKFAVPTTPVGSPGWLSFAYDPIADAATQQDNCVPITKGGYSFTLPATGTGSSTIPPIPVLPPNCTLRGTALQTPDGAVDNQEIKRRFDTGEPVYLTGRQGRERIVRAFWAPVDRIHWIEVEGFTGFGASGSMTLKPEGEDHRACALLESGTLVDTVLGFRRLTRTELIRPGDVLLIEVEGPDHEYPVAEGVWTHNKRP